jgi:hypothetical protein
MGTKAVVAASASNATAKAQDGPTDLEEADRLERQAAGDKQGKEAAIKEADANVKAAEAKIEKARKTGDKGEVDQALDYLKVAKAERKELD